jgi:P4 family phage/plasmid primase-like protien
MPLNLAASNSIDIAFIAQSLNERIHDLCLCLLGQPNKALSNKTQLRYRGKGSLAVEIAGDKIGEWYDHEKGVGGDALKLVCHELNMTNGAACAWAKDWLNIEPKTTAKTRTAKIPDILKGCIPVAGTPAERYLKNRGIVKTAPDNLAYRPNAYGEYGALVAKSTDERGNVLAVQQIYITNEGAKAPVAVVKRTNKAVEKWAEKSAVRFTGSQPIVLAEGVETALSIWQETGRETWACLGLSNIGNAPLPEGSSVTVARDGDIKGGKADIQIKKEIQKLAKRGFSVSVATPPDNIDFNSLLRNGSGEEVRALIAMVETVSSSSTSLPDQAHALFIGSDVEISSRVRDDLIVRHGKIIHAEGQFWRYTTTHWDIIPDHELRLATHMYDGAEYETPKGEPSRVKLGKSRVDSILHELTVLVTEDEFFTNAPIGINCASGFIRFSSEGVPTLEKHDREHRCRHTLPGHWNENQEKRKIDDPLLSRLLRGVFHDDEDASQKISLLAEVCGAAALGYATKLLQPRAVILKGEKAENGKSQILDLARGLLPISAISSVPAGRMGDERHVIGLIGKLLNASDELSSSSAISSETFKAVVTGEPIDGRDVYKSRIEFRPVAQHIFATNTLPPFQGGMDRGVQRRLVVIPFNRIIPLEERIEAIGRRIAIEEADLLLEWAVEGASRLIKQRNFTIPPSSKTALDDWILIADPVLAWLDQCVTIKPHSGGHPCISTRAAYDSFRDWAVYEGYRNEKLPAINGFVQRVQANAPELEHKRTKDGRLFLGMTITRTAHSLSSAPYASTRW